MAETIIEELAISIGFKPKMRELEQAQAKAVKAADETSKRWKEASTKVERAQDAVAAANTKAARAVARRWLRTAKKQEKAAREAAQAAGKAAKEIERDFKKAATSAEKDAGALREAWTGAFREVGAMAARAFAQAAGAGARFAADLVKQGKVVKDQAGIVGANTNEYQRVVEGFKLVGIEADNSFEAIKTFRENLGELSRLGSGPARDALRSVGFELEEVIKLPLEDQLGAWADAINKLPPESEALSVVIEAMGEDGQKILPALRRGSQGIKELGDRAEETGVVMSDELLDTMSRLDEQSNVVEAKLKGALIPAVADAASGMSQWVDDNEEFIDQDMPELVDTMATAVGGLATAFASVASFIADTKREADALADSMSDFAIDQSLADAGAKRAIEDFLGLDRGTLGGISKESERASRRRTGSREAVGFLGGDANPNNVRLAQQRESIVRRGQGGVDRANAIAASYGAAAQGAAAAQEANRLAKASTTKARERYMTDTTEGRRRTARETVARLGSERAAAQFLDVSEADIQGLLGSSGASSGGRRRPKAAPKAAAETKTGASGDPLMSMLLGEDVPDVELSSIARGAEPQVLISNITNNFKFDIDQNIDGAGSPSEVAQRTASAIRDKFEGSVSKSTKTAKVRFAR